MSHWSQLIILLGVARQVHLKEEFGCLRSSSTSPSTGVSSVSDHRLRRLLLLLALVVVDQISAVAAAVMTAMAMMSVVDGSTDWRM
jgi:hypothetical protein